MKPEPEYRDYDFRAVYITHNQDGTTDYRSLPLAEAKAYDTVGLYDFDKEGEGLEEKHVADICRAFCPGGRFPVPQGLLQLAAEPF